MKVRVIVDIKTNRIIFFTKDTKAVLHSDPQHNMIVDYEGEWPEDLLLTNCWEFSLRRGVIKKDATINPTSMDLLSRNKEALKNLLSDIIAEKRKAFLPSSVAGIKIRGYKLREALDYVEKKGGDYPWLSSLAVARNITLAEAATIVTKRETDENRVLLQTEKQREALVAKIDKATEPKQLDTVRDEILLLRG